MKKEIKENPYTPLSKLELALAKGMLVEGLGMSFVMGFELIRASLVNPLISFERAAKLTKSLKPALSPDSPLFPILQNAGDFYDGYLYSWLGYNLLSAADSLQRKLTHRSLPEKWRLGISLAVSSLGLTWIEAGLPFFGKKTTPDYGDIPAIFVGTAAYLGIHVIAGRKIDKWNNRIKAKAQDWYAKNAVRT